MRRLFAIGTEFSGWRRFPDETSRIPPGIDGDPRHGTRRWRSPEETRGIGFMGEEERYDAEVEALAVKVACAFEEAAGAVVRDVSKPLLSRAAGLEDNPGFDLLSHRPIEGERGIEVKGRAGFGDVELTENEWVKACNHGDRYWLYVVFDCGSPHPRLLRARDPFGKLVAKAKGSVRIDGAALFDAAERE